MIREFEAAWARPGATRYAIPRYPLNPLLHGARVTAGMLWDAEVRKARDPVKYVPAAFAASRVEAETRAGFRRVSRQRAWADGLWIEVREAVHLDPHARRIVFRAERSGAQPPFWVEHRVLGTEDEPIVGWRLVLETEQRDRALEAQLAARLGAHQVPPYLGVYLEDLGRPVAKRPDGPVEVVADARRWERPFGPRGPAVTRVWGTLESGAHGSLLRFAAGSAAPLHTHPHDSWGVVVSGRIRHRYEGQSAGAWMGPGSWYFEPAGVPHVSEVGAEGEAVVLVFNPGPFGFVPRPAR